MGSVLRITFSELAPNSDGAIAWLLLFLSGLLHYLSRFSPRIQQMSALFPSSLYLKDKFIADANQCDLPSIKKYVVCPSCHSLNEYDECFEKSGSSFLIKNCTNCVYSRPCNTALLKKVILRSNSIKPYPHKFYCYCSVTKTLQHFLMRPRFAEICEEIRCLARKSSGLLSDVYDGRIWHNFTGIDGEVFLSMAYCYAFALNVDWFQPFDRHIYSVGVIYLIMLNLPRSIRYKRENVLLVGIIPGPNEPSQNINSYLSPLVFDLLDLWNGLHMNIHGAETKKLVRAALVLVSCDLPAGRKVCGFLSHSAKLGCSKCYCNLVDSISNFDRDNWTFRTNSKHRLDVETILKCTSKRECERKALELGCRFSTLLNLPYFDPVRMLVVDPMHNLFLGTTKYFTRRILLEEGILSKENLKTINERLSKLKNTVDIGRLPSNIDSGSTFTAEQWMNWTLYFSIFCLHGLIPNDHMECWRHFVLACRKLCKKTVTENDVTVGDLLLIQFCRRMKRIFGPRLVTPNMHMHCHLAACIRDYGPLHCFWAFSFERYNGLLGSQPTNNRSVELQLMKRFIKDNIHFECLHHAASMPLADEFQRTIAGHALLYQSLSEVKAAGTEQDPTIVCPSKYTLTVLSDDFLTVLRNLYSIIYPQRPALVADTFFPSTCKKYKHISINGNKISSLSEGTNCKVPYVLTKMPEKDELIRPAQIDYFIHYSLSIPSHSPLPLVLSNVLAVCKWPMHHPKQHAYGKPIEVWCRSLFEPSINNTFVPVETICSRVIIAEDMLDDELVLITIPLV